MGDENQQCSPANTPLLIVTLAQPARKHKGGDPVVLECSHANYDKAFVLR